MFMQLNSSTKSEEIVGYTRTKVKYTLRVDRLETRHNVDMNWFVLRVATDDMLIFMKKEFRPKGAVYRRHQTESYVAGN